MGKICEVIVSMEPFDLRLLCDKIQLFLFKQNWHIVKVYLWKMVDDAFSSSRLTLKCLKQKK